MIKGLHRTAAMAILGVSAISFAAIIATMSDAPAQAKKEVPLALDGPASQSPWKRYNGWPARDMSKFNTLANLASPSAPKEPRKLSEPITGDALAKLYLDITRKYYGHEQKVAIVDDYIAHEWSFIPHFYRDFYVFQYATSFTAAEALSAKAATSTKAQNDISCILIWTQGGTSHHDTFDPKPQARAAVRGEFNVIDTPISGVKFTEVCPNFARSVGEYGLLPRIEKRNTIELERKRCVRKSKRLGSEQSFERRLEQHS